MSELPITGEFYDRSVRCTCFINELRSFFDSDKRITDTHFTPVINGYEVEYINSGISEKLCINIRSRFYGGLIIKKYVDGKFKKIYRTKDEFAETVNRILEK
ncbi:MAG: hypothetical protein IJB16_05470 [Clostridia bacterium]|nr:hypothetical protein [Clostridia bacterium]